MSTLSCVNPFVHSTDLIDFNNFLSNATIYDPIRRVFKMNEMIKNENVFGPLCNIKPTISSPPFSFDHQKISIVKSPNRTQLDGIYDQFFSSNKVKGKLLNAVNKKNMDALVIHRRASERPGYYCALCKKNGELPDFYRSHVLRDASGKVACPVLFAHVCEICGATGPDSHTRSYCPLVKQLKESQPNDLKIALMCSNIRTESHRARNGQNNKSFKNFKRRFHSK